MGVPQTSPLSSAITGASIGRDQRSSYPRAPAPPAPAPAIAPAAPAPIPTPAPSRDPAVAPGAAPDVAAVWPSWCCGVHHGRKRVVVSERCRRRWVGEFGALLWMRSAEDRDAWHAQKLSVWS